MRQVEMLVQFIARTLFHKDYINYEIVDEANLTGIDLLYKKLMKMIEEGQICEAENLFFDNLDEKDPEYLKLCLVFYQTLNQMSDDELETHNFSRQEVSDGLEKATKKFTGFPNLIIKTGI